MTIEIIHLSDTHFGNPGFYMSRRDFVKAFATLLNACSETPYLVISGDITFQGREDGYGDALEFLKSAMRLENFPPERVLACPGNHDIVNSSGDRNWFVNFDRWISALRNDNRCLFSHKHVRLLQDQDVDFAIINTAHHGDKTFGLADVRELEESLKMLPPLEEQNKRPRICVLHHHLVPVLDEDTSTLRNAYSVLELLQAYGFSLTVHGHQHAMLSLAVGHARMLISGVGSASYNTRGYMNSGALYKLEDGIVNQVQRFAISLDVPDCIAWIK